MIKRLFDLTVSLIALIILFPIISIFSFLIWIQDWKSPFYIAQRVGKNGKLFKMIKFRSMIVNADKSGVDSTAENDTRITSLGRFIRKYKIDELPNFFNITSGEMSFVGPRPNVKRETDLYTDEEKLLLSVRPGITDFSSIIFSDESEILKGSKDPDLDYNQLIRPWKSRLGILYIKNKTFIMDIYLIILTAVSIFSREKSLLLINKLLSNNKADEQLLSICLRTKALEPFHPPGTNSIVISRKPS